MLRVSRTIRAINQWNPVVDVIMFFQEKIRDLSRHVVNCPVLEAKVERLRMNLQTLKERLNNIRRERHRFEMKRNELEWEAYLQRFQLYEYQISYLGQVPYPILPRPPRWVSTLSSSNHPPTWSENSFWNRSNPLNSLPDPSFSANNSNNNEEAVNNSEADN
ncbi:10994_t:CDS:2, partial [Diversispora eburnea]